MKYDTACKTITLIKNSILHCNQLHYAKYDKICSIILFSLHQQYLHDGYGEIS